MWFGLTGRNAAGKTTIVEWLAAQGHIATSCSDSIRAHLQSQGLDITRDNLIQGGRDLRAAGGAGILAEMLRDAHQPDSDVAIDSIRTPAEVAALAERSEFRLIEVRALRDTRWQRLQDRGRAGDPTDWQTFVAQEEAELIAADDSGQALDATAALADILIDNEGDLAALHNALEALLKPDDP
jgi:dephospho-CoA kinase